MKNLALMLLLSFMAISANSQNISKSILSKEDYQQKSKNQKNAAWIMLGGGMILTAVGALSIESSSEDDSLGIPDGSSVILTLTGVATTLASIPLFISSARNSRKAKSLTLEFKPKFPQNNCSITQHNHSTISLKFIF